MSAEVRHFKRPNFYELAGDGIQLTYSTSSFEGSPHFNYHSASVNKLFVGEQIRLVETELGTLVTVMINQTPDAGSTSFTLLVPRVNLRVSDGANIVTEGITTLHKTSIIGPPNGQTDFYTTHRLHGTASFVFF